MEHYGEFFFRETFRIDARREMADPEL